MDTVQGFQQFKSLEIGARRREAVRTYLAAHKGIIARIAARAGVNRTMVSLVLHGRAVSAPVEQAIGIEENEYEQVA
jgi:hypothetical protein